MPKVSICIPAYENAEGIQKLLRSIEEQTYTDFEVIVSDDSRTGAVEQAVRAEAARLTVRYFRHDAPHGAAANWNACLDAAQGDYVKIMHDDDRFTFPDSLASFVRLLDEHPEADLAFSGSRQEVWGRRPEKRGRGGRRGHGAESGSEHSAREISGLEQGTDTECGAEETLRVYDRAADGAYIRDLRQDWRLPYAVNQIGAPSAVIVRRSAVRFDEQLTWIVDAEYYLHLLSGNPHFAATERPLVTIAEHEGQLTSKVSGDAQINCREYVAVFTRYHLADDARAVRALADVWARFHAPASSLPDGTGLSAEAWKAAYREAAERERRAAGKRRADTRRYLLGRAVAPFRRAADRAADRLEPVRRALIGLSTALFWAALLLELMEVIVDKSNYTEPFISQVFRLTFVLFFCRVLTTKYDRKELRWLLPALLLGVLSWRFSGRNELLRFTVFVAACRDINKRTILKVMFWVTTLGCAVLALLSVTGVYGILKLTDDFGHGMETRWCFGLGHPNACHCMAAMLCILALYLWQNRFRWYHYLWFALFNAVLYSRTKSNTGFAILGFALLLSALLHYSRRFREGAFPYVCAEVLFALALVFSVSAAVFGVSDPLFARLDGPLTGRISALYDTIFHEGTLYTWTLLGARRNQYYFDMGWVRVVYWYGVIPATIIFALIFAFLRQIRRNRDSAAVMMMTCFIIYTVVEAHLVSVFLARNYALVVFAAYLPLLCGSDRTVPATGGKV